MRAFALTPRHRHILTGLSVLVVTLGLITVGVKAAFGAFHPSYQLSATFDAAGQGLIPGSDVKIRGVNVGNVRGVSLDKGRARVTMDIDDDQKVPVSAEAIIRPKTLFGEKFVDIRPGAGERRGPFYRDGDQIEKTLGGFELEKVLTSVAPLLDRINPDELYTVLHTLAEAGSGLGPAINRTIVNSERVFDVAARHDADIRLFLEDLAALSQELDRRADDVVAGAQAFNVALPTLAENGDRLNALLRATSSLSNDVADLIEGNTEFVDTAFTDGQRTLDALFEHREQLVPAVVGLRQYVETLSSVIRIPVGDGTSMAAVKGLLFGEPPNLPLSPALEQFYAQLFGIEADDEPEDGPTASSSTAAGSTSSSAGRGGRSASKGTGVGGVLTWLERVLRDD